MSETIRRNLWRCMISRCHNPRHPNYRTYGARGITVCERWRASFEAFLEDVGPRPVGTTLDRIDNDRGYEPGNVRWATRAEQALNRRDTRLVEYQGRMMTLKEVERLTCVNETTLRGRMKRGMSLQAAIARPVDARFRSQRKRA